MTIARLGAKVNGMPLVFVEMAGVVCSSGDGGWLGLWRAFRSGCVEAVLCGFDGFFTPVRWLLEYGSMGSGFIVMLLISGLLLASKSHFSFLVVFAGAVELWLDHFRNGFSGFDGASFRLR